MGLAASQARLLTITARKADCEFRSMTLSHQKMALSRDLDMISTEYQNALNLTKLMYCTSASSSNIPISYDLLMKPSIYNDYFPKLLTDQTNRVVLSHDYAEAARAAGIPAEGLSATSSSTVRNAFIEALSNQGVITPNKAATIEGVDYCNTIGLGETTAPMQKITELSYDDLIRRIETRTDSSGDCGLSLGGVGDWKYKLINDITGQTVKNGGEQGLAVYRGTSASSTKCLPNDTAIGTPETGMEITLAELLSTDDADQITMRMDGFWGERSPIVAAYYIQQKSGEVLDWITDQFGAVLGGTDESDSALQAAYNAVYDIIYGGGELETQVKAILSMPQVNEYKEKLDDRKYKGTSLYYGAAGGSGMFGGGSMPSSTGMSNWTVLNSIGTAVEGKVENNMTYLDRDKEAYQPYGMERVTLDQSRQYLGLVYCDYGDSNVGYNFNAGPNYWITGKFTGYFPGVNAQQARALFLQRSHANATMNLNNLAQAFLTSYVEAMEGAGSSAYNIQKGSMSKCDMYDPETSSFKFTVVDEVELDEEAGLHSTFYDAMFNMICTHGWTENYQVEDNEYLAQMFANGNIYLSSISDDGMYYQSNYAADKSIIEVADDEAIAKAEAKYTAEKNRIEAKEQRIDMKMKNLDTELSALTTEYDSTKQVITKAIEKSFKRYEA